MFDPVRAKVRLVAFTGAAFAGGILLASGMGWTAGSQAATLFQTAAPTPSRAAIQPVADLSQAFISISESVTPAVVSIEAERPPRASSRQVPEELRELFPFFESPQGQGGGGGGRVPPEELGGSGFIISPDGYILTNNHVVERSTKIDVIMADNRRLPAKLIGADPLTDVAVIKIEGRFTSTRMGSSESARIGEWVLAIGNPLELGTTVTSGIISAKGRALNVIGRNAEENSQWAIEDFIQTDAAINPGNSGGPLVNLRGEVIGINSVIASRTGFYSGYGFAIPIDLARRIGDDLIRYGRVRRAVLGVQVRPINPEDAEVYRLPRISGVLVQDFEDNSPAERAGLRQGDVIMAVNGQPVEGVGELQRRVTNYKPGETVTLEVVRNGQQRDVRVPLIEAPLGADEQPATAARQPGRQPARESRPARPAEPVSLPAEKLGIQVAPLTAQLAQQYEYRQPGGVVITNSDRYGPMGRRGFGPGWKVASADNQQIADVRTLQRIVDAKKPGEILSLLMENPTGQRTIVNVRIEAPQR